MTSVSLHSSYNGYQLSGCEIALCVATVFTAIPYALRHIDQAFDDADEVSWSHITMGFLECLPILGAIIGLIEYCICSGGIFLRTPQQPAEPPLSTSAAEALPVMPIAERARLKNSAFKMLQARTSRLEHGEDYDHTRHELPHSHLWEPDNSPSAEFRRLLEDSVNKTNRNKKYGTVLHLAAFACTPTFVKCILDLPEGKDLLNIGDGSGDTPLMEAISSLFEEVTLGRRVTSPAEITRFRQAVSLSKEEMVDAFLDHNAHLNILNSKNETSLFLALKRERSFSLIQKLLQRGATLRIVDGQPNPPLSEEELERLLSAYRPLEAQLLTSSDSLKLSASVDFQQLSVEEQQRVKNGAFTRLKARTPSLYCAKPYEPHKDVLPHHHLWEAANAPSSEFRRLLEQSLNQKTFNKRCGTVLNLAVFSGNLPFIKCILELPEGQDLLNIADLRGETPLADAFLRKEKIVEYLLTFDVNVNCLNKNNETPLFLAIRDGSSLPLIQKLLQRGATLRFVDDQPNPPLSDRGLKRLLSAYYRIEMALKEALEATIPHQDLHALIISYYWSS